MTKLPGAALSSNMVARLAVPVWTESALQRFDDLIGSSDAADSVDVNRIEELLEVGLGIRVPVDDAQVVDVHPPDVGAGTE